MRSVLFFICIITILCSCNSDDASEAQNATSIQDSTPAQNYFPVTSFIKGIIYTIRTEKSNPIKVITRDEKKDTTWLKMENLEHEMSAFLTPVIDTANLKHKYVETKFLDKTINLYTFTYDLRDPADTATLRSWTVYVDGESGKVTNINMEKRSPSGKQLLSFFTDTESKIITVAEDKVVKEERIIWEQTEEEND